MNYSAASEALKSEIENRIAAWANAWSEQDPDAYLSYYASDFVPPKKMSRKAWEKNRRQRLKAPGFIKVDVNNVQVILHGQEHSQAIFSQKYQSDTYKDRVTKVMLLKKHKLKSF